MAKNKGHFDRFAAHTRLKHAIYGRYVERWARILLSRWDTIRIVDACAGAGADDEGRPGSPIIALKEGRKAASQLTGRTNVRKRVEFVFIERSKGRLSLLRSRVGEHPEVTFVQGTLTDAIDTLAPAGRSIPHLYFIDPFGISPLDAETIRRALIGGHNEVFLLFAGPAIRRHFGSLLSVHQENPIGDLFSEFELGVGNPNEKVEEARTRGAASSERILDTAFGAMGWRDILDLAPNRRLEAAVARYCEILLGLGATRVLPMPIVDGSGNLKYHLIYATKSPRGYEVMKDAIERGLGEGLVGKEEHMRLGSTVPTSEVERLVRQHFSGREVLWSRDGVKDTVKAYALENTPASVRQVKELKERLKALKLDGREQRYRFPSG